MSDQTVASRPIVTAGDIDRPLSPHLQVWRWTVTMASSIAQRATGIAQYAGMALLVGWLLAAAVGEATYTTFMQIMASPIGLLILIGYTLSVMYHTAKGLLHLIWDSGHLIAKPQAKMATMLCFGFAVIATIIIWAIGFGIGG